MNHMVQRQTSNTRTNIKEIMCMHHHCCCSFHYKVIKISAISNQNVVIFSSNEMGFMVLGGLVFVVHVSCFVQEVLLYRLTSDVYHQCLVVFIPPVHISDCLRVCDCLCFGLLLSFWIYG